jgi:hypothetical protein
LAKTSWAKSLAEASSADSGILRRFRAMLRSVLKDTFGGMMVLLAAFFLLRLASRSSSLKRTLGRLWNGTDSLSTTSWPATDLLILSK